MRIEAKDPVLNSLFNEPDPEGNQLVKPLFSTLSADPKESFNQIDIWNAVGDFATSLKKEHQIRSSCILKEMLSYYIINQDMLGVSKEAIIDKVNEEMAYWDNEFRDLGPSEDAA